MGKFERKVYVSRVSGPERLHLDSTAKVFTNFTHASPRELLDHLCKQEAKATSMEIKCIC